MNLNYTIKNTFSNIYIPTISSFKEKERKKSNKIR